MQLLRELIDRAVDHAVEYQGDQELLDLGRRDVDLARDEADRDARVRLDDLEQHLPNRAIGRTQMVAIRRDRKKSQSGGIIFAAPESACS